LISAFGLGTMIYNGLEFGSWFEIPVYSACYSVLRGANPVLQMVFTFMQMYFIFMNSRVSRLLSLYYYFIQRRRSAGAHTVYSPLEPFHLHTFT
jgi:Otopetrin